MQLQQASKVCPAASEHGNGVFCRVEHSFLSYQEHPVSVARFCCGDYQACPSWRSERENELAQRRFLKTKPLVSKQDAKRKTKPRGSD